MFTIYNNQNSLAYICLDAEKAIDTSNWLEVFKKIREKGTIVPPQITRFLIQLYLNSEAIIWYGNNHSNPFKLTQGIRQGSIMSPHLYNLYTEGLIMRINRLQIGTILPTKIDTSIIAFADDLLLISPTWKGLQLMLDECVRYGLAHGLKFNEKKTQFVVSGKSPLQNPTLHLDQDIITPCTEIKHLGFTCSLKSNKMRIQQHVEKRICEMWATTSTMISAGARKFQPKSIVSLFKSIILSKPTYGMEKVNLSTSVQVKLNQQARCCLKSLPNVSTHSKNLIHKLFDIPEATNIVDANTINLATQPLKNRSTEKHLLDSLTLKRNDTSSMITNRIDIVCRKHKINFLDKMITGKKHPCSNITNN